MKIIVNFWKTGAAIFLCFSLLSVSVLACDDPDDYEEHQEAFVETTEMFFTEEQDVELPGEDEEAEVPASMEGTVRSAETEKHTSVEEKMQSSHHEDSKSVKAAEEDTTDANTELAVGTVVKSGDCGYVTGTMFYTISYLGNCQYKLTISGTGKMLMIAVSYGAPWNHYAADIVEIEIKDGVEGIREYAFNGCDQVTTLTIPASVNYIEKGSFNMAGLRSVYFLGPYYEKFKADAFSGTTDVTVYHRGDLNWGGFTFTGTAAEASDISLQLISANEPTCTNDGNVQYFYSPTWDKYFSDKEAKAEITDKKDLIIPAPGHDWDAGVLTTEPTTTKEGVITYTCRVCSETKTAVVSLPGINEMPDDGTMVPDLKDDMTQDETSVNVSVNIQNKPGNSQMTEKPSQTENTSAGQVKTADKNPYVLYLALLTLSGMTLIAIIRKRI